MKTLKFKSFLLTLLILVLGGCGGESDLTVGLAPAEVLTPTPVPTPTPIPTPYLNICTDGAVYSIAQKDTTVFIGGAFNMVGDCAHKSAGVLMEPSKYSQYSSMSSVPWPQFDFHVRAIISDGAGGYFVGGDFFRVDDQERSRLAHIDANGNLNPLSITTTSSINALAYDSANGILYIGGAFTTINGVTRNNVAAINVADNTLVATFDPNVNSTVQSLQLDSANNILYLGGWFTTVGGTTRNRVAAVSTVDGSLVGAFNPNALSAVYSIILDTTNNILYVGGAFTTIAATGRNRIAAVNTADGSIVPAFNPNLNGAVRALALNSAKTTLYMGGDFTTVGGTARDKVAAVSTATGSLVAGFVPELDSVSSAHSFALDEVNGFLYLGGTGLLAGGGSIKNIARLNLTDGSLDTTFAPNPNGYVAAIHATGSKLFFGGGFQYAFDHWVARDDFALLDTLTNTVLPYDPQLTGGGWVTELLVSGNILYVGGGFTGARGVTRNGLAAFDITDAATPTLTTFDPDVGGSVYCLAEDTTNNILYIGGRFSTIGGTARNAVGAVSTVDGSLIVGFDPSADEDVEEIALNGDGSTLYVAGWFFNIGGAAQYSVAALSTADGTAVPGFAPVLDAEAYELHLNGNELYLGGWFTDIDGTAVTNIARLDATTGALDLTFTPATDSDVYKILTDGEVVYYGGDFWSVEGEERYYFVAVDKTTGIPTTLSVPDLISFNRDVWDMAFGDDGYLYLGHTQGALSVNLANP